MAEKNSGKKIILGITGSFGAGKGAVVKYLVSKKNFTHYSAREFITRELREGGSVVNRDTMIQMGNILRKLHGPAYIVEMLFMQAKERGGNAVIESLRAIAEVRKVKEWGGIVLGIDADPKLRYERARARASETDAVSFEEWLAQEKMESNSADSTKQDIFGALKESDYIIQNNGSIEELHGEIEKILREISN